MQVTNIKNTKTYLNNILIRSPGSIYWKDRDGVYLGCNQFQADMAGFTAPDDIIGKQDNELPWKDIADILKDTDQRIMNSGIPEEIIEKPILFSGKQLIMFTKKSPLYDEFDNIIGIIGVSLDITERIVSEEQEKLTLSQIAFNAETNRKIAEETKRAIAILACSIAHDLRTPLFCISSISYILKNSLPILLQHYNNAGEEVASINHLNDPKIHDIENILDHVKNLITTFLT